MGLFSKADYKQIQFHLTREDLKYINLINSTFNGGKKYLFTYLDENKKRLSLSIDSSAAILYYKSDKKGSNDIQIRLMITDALFEVFMHRFDIEIKQMREMMSSDYDLYNEMRKKVENYQYLLDNHMYNDEKGQDKDMKEEIASLTPQMEKIFAKNQKDLKYVDQLEKEDANQKMSLNYYPSRTWNRDIYPLGNINFLEDNHEINKRTGKTYVEEFNEFCMAKVGIDREQLIRDVEVFSKKYKHF